MGSIEAPRKFYTEPADVPVVDYRALKGTGETHQNALAQLDRAFRTYGFAYISNHSIPQQKVDEAFAWVSWSCHYSDAHLISCSLQGSSSFLSK